jgi:hypothetical protein
LSTFILCDFEHIFERHQFCRRERGIFLNPCSLRSPGISTRSLFSQLSMSYGSMMHCNEPPGAFMASAREAMQGVTHLAGVVYRASRPYRAPSGRLSRSDSIQMNNTQTLLALYHETLCRLIHLYVANIVRPFVDTRSKASLTHLLLTLPLLLTWIPLCWLCVSAACQDVIPVSPTMRSSTRHPYSRLCRICTDHIRSVTVAPWPWRWYHTEFDNLSRNKCG